MYPLKFKNRPHWVDDAFLREMAVKFNTTVEDVEDQLVLGIVGDPDRPEETVQARRAMLITGFGKPEGHS